VNAWHKLNVCLLLLLVTSAMAVVHTNFRARKLTTQVDKAKLEGDRLEARFRALQIEEGRWTAPGQVREKAAASLGMVMIDDKNRQIIEVGRGL
jgi:cell division protein FtsL